MITFPLSAVGETLYDARGNPIAVFKDYRDAEAVADMSQEAALANGRIASLQQEVCDLKQDLRDFIG